MRRPRARRSLLTAVSISVLATIGGCAVDKQATGENLINDVEKTHSIKLSATGRDCLLKLISGLTSDELQALNQAKASTTLTSRFVAGEIDCVPAIGAAPAPTGSTVPSTTTSPANSSPTVSSPTTNPASISTAIDSSGSSLAQSNGGATPTVTGSSATSSTAR